jgi:hypothetical protein
MGDAGSVLLFGAFCFGGTLVCYRGTRALKVARASEAWPPARGRVTVSEVVEVQSSDLDRLPRRYFKPRVRFRYRVEGEKYWSENVTTVEVSSTSRDLAEELVRRYPKGSKVDVYVDPKDPTMAVLERGSSAGALFVAIGVLFTLVGVCGLLFMPG